MPMFLVIRRQSGPAFVPGQPLESQSGWEEHARFMDGLVADGFIVLGGPVAADGKVAFAVEAASEDDVHATFARDNWTGSHLLTESVEPWTVRLDGRSR
jgi:hypothetical protein